MLQCSHLRRRYYVDEVPGLAIFVRELPLDITADKLGGAFAAFGPVRHVNLKTQKGKDSFAFVTFESTEAASAAIERPPVIGGVQARTPAAGDRVNGRAPEAMCAGCLLACVCQRARTLQGGRPWWASRKLGAQYLRS